MRHSAGAFILDGTYREFTVTFVLTLGYRYSLIKKHMKKDEEGKLSAVQHLTASAEAGKQLKRQKPKGVKVFIVSL